MSSLLISKGLYLVIYKTLALINLYSSKSVKDYLYARIQAKICMFTQQNHRVFQSTDFASVMIDAADVISVSGVKTVCELFVHLWDCYFSIY